VQVNLFVEACRSAGVLVLTPITLYDFNHPTDGEAHAHRFRTRICWRRYTTKSS
jgi:hypothetical protein